MAQRTALGVKVLAGLVLALVALLAAAGHAEGKVIALDDDSFEHLTQAATGATTGDWFVKFYSQQCGQCKRIAPVWTKLGEALLGEVNVAEVDVKKETGIRERFSISTVPTLVYFHKGEMFVYKGKRDLESLSAFVELVRFGEPADLPSGTPVPPAPLLRAGWFRVLESVPDGVLIVGATFSSVLVILLCLGGAAKKDGQESSKKQS